MIIQRLLEKNLLESIKKNSVLFITGPRQSGKTTLVKNLFKDYLYKNLENPEIRLFAYSDPKNFLNQSSKLIIDEIQRVPELLSYIQSIVDEDEKRRFIITGSQNILISQKISQSLAGRVAIFNLLPFSLQELKTINFYKKDLYEQIFFGFYPRIYDRNLNPLEWYPNYIQTYLERDVREIKNIANLIDFQRFLKLCAGRVGQILDLSSLANDVGVSVNTIKGWLSILEATFIAYRLPPFYKNFNKRIIKSPKIYFYDTGLVCSLLGIKNKEQLQTHPFFGSIWENFCISEMVKQNYHHNLNLYFYYFRNKSGSEVDLIYEKNNQIYAIEIKSSATFSESFVKNLYYLEKISGNKIKKIIIYTGLDNNQFKDVLIQRWMNMEL